MLSMETTTREYSLLCCPVIHYLLSLADFACERETSPDIQILLDVVEKAGDQLAYVLPTLIIIAKKHRVSNVGKHVRRLITAFPEEALAAKTFLLHQI
jgi:hypothetical protein